MKKPSNILALLLLILTGLCVFSPYFDYQPWLSTGDHGLNLYAAEAALRGELPYHDYHWFYGPLMPYYYALFFKIFGAKITSAIIGQIALNILSGCFIFAGLSLFTSPLIAFGAAIWFWAFDFGFHYTYNHFGGIMLSTLLLYYHFLYIKTSRKKTLYACLFVIFLLSFVKINIGLSALAAFCLSVTIKEFLDGKLNSKLFKIFLLSALAGIPLLLGIAHYFLLKGLPFYIIKQGFQYFGTDAFKDIYPPLSASLLSLPKLLFHYAKTSVPQFGFCLLLLACFVKIIFCLRKTEKAERNAFFAASAALLLYYLFLLHEYLISGIFYRRIWSAPFLTALCFLLIGYAAKKFHKNLAAILVVAVLFLPIKRIFNDNAEISRFKVAHHSLPHPRGNIYYKNSPLWTYTVSLTLDFIENNMGEKDLFLAIPYEPLYYFLSGKPSPSRQLAFFDFIAIPKEQEKQIIQEIESHKTNYVLLSNRINSSEIGLGVFGETYCPLLARYIDENFETVATFGDWANPPGWAWNHSVQILKRKTQEALMEAIH